MLRSAASKVAWVGRTASMVFGLALVLALLFGVASMAFGANGGSFILGQNNVATAITRIAGAAGVNGPMLQLINNNPDANDTALALNVQAGEAPMRVNSNTRVANLNAASAGRADSAASADTAANADELDGKDSSDFVPGGNLPAGATIRGNYDFGGTTPGPNQIVGLDSISFVYTLPSTPNVRLIRSGTTPTSECPGTSPVPQADPGFLCIYETQSHNLYGSPIVLNPSRSGARIYGSTLNAGTGLSSGTWAVTAPTAD